MPLQTSAPVDLKLGERRATVPPWRGWGPLILLPVAVLVVIPGDAPRWMLMWALAVAIFVGCKWLTWRRTPVAGVPWWRHAAYVLAWPGMDCGNFLRSDQRPRQPRARDWSLALASVLLGAGLLWGVARWLPPGRTILVGWLGMIGLALLLHFGAFRLLSCGWRMLGVDARPLMDRPLASASISEFWGHRWNTAFRDLSHRFLFRPLRAGLGPRGALVAGFVCSGLVHELVISVPAECGYGWPTLYFLLQAAGILAERSRLGRRTGVGSGWRGRLFTALVVAVPAHALFHPPFVEKVVVPFLRALGAAASA
jgi:hypothetical protein